MLKLNLLPPKQKEELEWERNGRFVIFISGAVISMLVLFSLLLSSSIYYVEVQLSPLKEEIREEEKKAETQRAKLLRAKILDAAKKINNLKDIQEKQEKWSWDLLEIADLPYAGINLSTISISEKSRKVEREAENGKEVETEIVKEVRLIGIANTVTDLLVFEKILKEQSRFINIQHPSAQIVKEYDIDFIFTFDIISE